MAVPPGAVEFRPDYAQPPGALLKAVLDALDLTQSDLADRTGLSTKYVNQIIKLNATLSADTAVRLEAVTRVPAETWTAMEADFRAAEARAERSTVVQGWIDWLSNFKLTELRDRGVLSSSARSAATVDELLRFFGISSPDGWNRVWEPSLTRFRRSPSFTPETPATTIWLRIGQNKAVNMKTSEYSSTGLLELMPTICSLTKKPPAVGLAELPELCRKVGVAVVYAAELKGCHASGATWWANPTKAVVLLSNRGKREDRFWFSFFHECGHLLKHAKRDTYLDQSGPENDGPPWEDAAPISGFIDDGSRDSAVEREADAFASSTLIPAHILPALRSARSKTDIESIADELDIAPGVVVGRWQFERDDYTKLNELRRPLPAEPFMSVD
jgi:HTH-type transcriptional regulator/antitoxin HigA